METDQRGVKRGKSGMEENESELKIDDEDAKRRKDDAGSIQPEDTIGYEVVIRKTYGKLKDLMVPDPIIDEDTEETIFKLRDKRDIKDQKTTTEKNELILTKVRRQGANGYIKFKELLNRTQQGKVTELLTHTEKGLDTKEIEKELYEMAEKSLNLSPNYFQRKRELKEKLIKFYKNKQSTVPLSPLVEEVETNLAGFYVMPKMVFVKQKTLTSHQEERTPVRSLNDLLITGSEDQQNIYLSADAGFGKTSFSKYLAITWSQACCPDKNKKNFKDEELAALGNFEFLFLVLLRDTTAVCYIDEMIEQEIIKKLPLLASQCPLREVLDREKCLIILDGLDEWTHPDNGCSDQKEKIPHQYSRDNCVILTTTRPWKLGVSNLKMNDRIKKAELVKLNEDSTYQLEKNAIRKMSGVEDENELRGQTKEFDKVILSRGLKHMQTIPLLLMYITCLWCNKIPIGNSKVEVYINIIEFLLSRTTQKNPEVHPSSEHSQSDIPELFKKTTCQKFYSLLTTLAKLAYHTLFSEKRENTLVFDKSVAEKYLKADDMKLSFLSGILTGSTTKTLMERSSKVSFSHKTVQEFFAAIFISSQSDGQKTVVEKCKNIQSILDMSMICEFLSKMNSEIMCEILPGLMSVINEDEETRKYRTRTDDVDIDSLPLYNIQKMLVSCLQEIPQSKNIKLYLQDFFIDDDDTIHDKHLQRLSKLNKTNIKSLYIDMPYGSSTSLREVNELFSLTDLNSLHKLYYCGDYNKEADISLLLSPSLQTASLSFATWTNYKGNLGERFGAMKNVQYLDISGLRLSHEIQEIIYNFISGNKAIKELYLDVLDCKEHDDDCTENLDLSIKHSQLEKLVLESLPPLKLTVTSTSLVDVKLRSINLGESSLLLSPDMLNIEHVELEVIKMSVKSFRDFILVVEKLPQSITVKIDGCKIEPETEYERVRNYIRSSKNFYYDKRCLPNNNYDDGDKKFEFRTRNNNYDDGDKTFEFRTRNNNYDDGDDWKFEFRERKPNKE